MKITPTIPVAQKSEIPPHLKSAAVELEATFLAQMLKSAGLGKTSQSFGGGAEEDQFSSFLVQHQARQLAQSGGIGLSEILITAMMEKSDVK
ncbi:MAG: rod-binding protein [Ruegeria sp.]